MSSAPRTLLELADRIAAYRALDVAMFEVLGQRATTSSGAPWGRHLAGWAHHHAWHAELWAGRFPSLPGLEPDPTALVADPAVPNAEDAARALHGVSDAGNVELVRRYIEWVLVPLEAAVTDHRNTTSELLDAPTCRVLDLVLSDLRRDHVAASELSA